MIISIVILVLSSFIPSTSEFTVIVTSNYITKEFVGDMMNKTRDVLDKTSEKVSTIIEHSYTDLIKHLDKNDSKNTNKTEKSR